MTSSHPVWFWCSHRMMEPPEQGPVTDTLVVDGVWQILTSHMLLQTYVWEAPQPPPSWSIILVVTTSWEFMSRDNHSDKHQIMILSGSAGQNVGGTYAYMHICTKSIEIFFGIFFDFILVLLSFHCLHTILIFSENFPIFFAVLFILFISKKPVISTWHSYLLPFRRPRVVRNQLYNMRCARPFRRQISRSNGIKTKGRLWDRDGVYVGSDTHPHFYPQWFYHHWGGKSPH